MFSRVVEAAPRPRGKSYVQEAGGEREETCPLKEKLQPLCRFISIQIGISHYDTSRLETPKRHAIKSTEAFGRNLSAAEGTLPQQGRL